MKNPRGGNWNTINQPKPVIVNWSFDKADYDKLVVGVIAQSMDSKWDISFNDNVVRCYRSWTGFEVYNFAIKQNDAKYVVKFFNVEQDSTKYRCGDDKHETESLSLLLEHIVGVKPQ